MTKTQTTKQLLLHHGQRLFWSCGYSNVPVREIAKAAGVDVALISRYFGSKRGLFEATLAPIEGIDAAALADEAALTDMLVELFATAPRGPDHPSALTMILMNARDGEVGDLVRDFVQIRFQGPMEAIIGDRDRAALFTAVLFGISVAEKFLHLEGIAPPDSPAYERQLRLLIAAALTYEPAEGPAE